MLGEQVWREAGIGGPDDTEQLKARITTLTSLNPRCRSPCGLIRWVVKGRSFGPGCQGCSGWLNMSSVGTR
ncbi:hypothetical protein [Streptomyces sp. NPDC051567]|uniref:hypothetical protein n=1 Tax=Streptomyces sp. NPDC051567 TaxID=3365660 RepID=UPI0037888025